MRFLFLLLVCGLALPYSSSAQDSSALLEAFRSGTPVVDFRLRGEQVESDAVADAAQALTLRTLLGYRTAGFQGLSLYLEAEAVSAPLGDDGYANAGAGALNNGVTGRPVIADPVGTQLNQAYLRVEREQGRLTLGRQEIVLSDSRFIGNVGWRQNHQSFDAARVDISASKTVSATYAFIREAHRITGQQATMRSHVAEATVGIGSIGSVTAYGFLLDYPDAAALSTTTLGARFVGNRPLFDGATGQFEASYAMQTEAYENPADLQANYLNIAARVKSGRVGEPRLGIQVTTTVGYELLSGSPEDGAFATPLATLHKFNGWADQFLGTPATGLADFQIGVSASLKRATLAVIFHDFAADTGGAHYGSEIDLQLTYATEDRLGLGVKAARYMADELGSSTTKLWLWTSLGL